MMTNSIKDMKLMENLAVDAGMPHQVIAAALSKAQGAASRGWADYDSSLFGVEMLPSAKPST